jgi:hypothetical protein
VLKKKAWYVLYIKKLLKVLSIMKKLALGLSAFALSAVVAAPSQAVSFGDVSLTLNSANPFTGTVSNIVNGNIAGATLGVNTSGNGLNNVARTDDFNPTALFGGPLSSLFVDIDYNNYVGTVGSKNLNFRVWSNGSIFGTFLLANNSAPSSGSFTFNLLGPNPTGINLTSVANTNLSFSYILNAPLNNTNTVNFQTSVRFVPEPTTMAGLFVFGAAVATRKKLAKKAAV